MTVHRLGFGSVTALWAAICMFGLSTQSLQAWQDSGETNLEAANRRIVELESRVERLEGLMFSTIQLSEYDAQRRLAVARRTLEQNKRLYFRGLLTSIEIQRSRYEVRRAERELDLAVADFGQRRISGEIEVMRAEFELEFAEDRLQRSRNRSGRSYVSEYQLKQNVDEVDRATQALELAREKLNALEPEPTPAPDSSDDQN